MRAADFTFVLPDSQIALHPAEPRDSSRLMIVDRHTGQRTHKKFRDLPSYLRPGDLLVMNDTRVLPARLFVHSDKGREFELLLLKELTPLSWRCLARPGKKIGKVTFLNWPDGVTAEIERDFEREFRVDFSGLTADEFLPWLEKNGKMPLPPYLKRPATQEDATRYQTVFAKTAASVAAPTAGLHFTPELLKSLETNGVETARVTLEIGYGTFAPIHAETLDTHQMHSETYRIPAETQAAVDRAQREGRRVIAVGTTSLRALESWDSVGPQGSTSIFIKPGHTFKRVDGLITNFHLPESTLLILVCAFLGKEATLSAYTEAVQEGYRFFSYGDAMAILP